jgi:hypothetical protein
MSTILAHIVVRVGREAEFEALAVTLFDVSHATETRLRGYGYWRGQEPRHYYTLLAFDDYVGFLEHQSSDHHEEASPPLRECLESIRLEWVDPVAGASKLAPTNPLAVRYATTMPAQVAEWWKPLRSEQTGGAGT